MSKLIWRKINIRLSKTVIKPILMYGCEDWTPILTEERKLLVVKWKFLRKDLEPTQKEDGSWRLKKNSDKKDLLSELNYIGEAKAPRLRWFGHVARIMENHATKGAYFGRPIGRRAVGRHRYRCSDDVQIDVEDFGTGSVAKSGAGNQYPLWVAALPT